MLEFVKYAWSLITWTVFLKIAGCAVFLGVYLWWNHVFYSSGENRYRFAKRSKRATILEFLLLVVIVVTMLLIAPRFVTR